MRLLEPAGVKSLRVLIVGGGAEEAEAMLVQLRRRGFDLDPRRAETERDFFDCLEPSLHVILAEYGRPGFGGRDVVRRVRGLGLDIPVIIVSRMLGEEQVAGLMREGATDCILHDRLFKLGPAVDRALAERRMRQDKRHAEAALRESQRFLKGVVETSPNAVYTFDLEEKRFLLANNQVRGILGFAPEEIVELSIGDLAKLLPPEELPEVKAHFARIAQAKDEEVVELEHRCRHADGSWRWILNRIVVFTRDPDGRARQILGNVQDATERRRTMEALKESERRFRTLIENQIEGAALVDPQETCLYANPAAEAIVGVPRGTLAGRNLSEFMTPQEFARVREQTRLRAQGQTGTYFLQIRRADGETRTVRVTAVPQYDGQGRFEGAFGLFLDVTEDLRREAELTEARKLQTIGMVAGGLAHEVRNPLFAISTLVASLEKKLKDKPELAEHFKHVQDQVQRLSLLMKDLLLLGRPTDRNQFAPCSLVRLARETSALFNETIAGMDGRWELDAPPDDDLAVLGIPGKLSEVLVNLVQNALSFSPKGEKVRLRLWREDRAACLCVSDRGPGVPEEALDKLFEPFFTRREGGTGLGLAIVRQIVTAHDGTVTVENNTPHPGATFTVRLPLTAM